MQRIWMSLRRADTSLGRATFVGVMASLAMWAAAMSVQPAANQPSAERVVLRAAQPEFVRHAPSPSAPAHETAIAAIDRATTVTR